MGRGVGPSNISGTGVCPHTRNETKKKTFKSSEREDKLVVVRGAAAAADRCSLPAAVVLCGVVAPRRKYSIGKTSVKLTGCDLDR